MHYQSHSTMASFESKFSFTQDELELIVKRHYCQQKIDSGKFKITHASIVSLNENPIGYLGEHYILKVKVIPKVINFDRDAELNEEVYQFFIKFMNCDNEYLTTMNVFQKEILLYQFLLPRLQDFPIGIKKWAPNCYLIQKNKLMVFENLTEAGYELCPSPNNERTFDIEHLKVTLATLARFHASSLLFEERTQISIPQHYPGYLTENFYLMDPESTRYINLQNSVEVMVELAKKIPKYESNSEKVEFGLKNLYAKIHELTKPSKVYRNVVNHSDLWKNNILFKYEIRNELNTTSENKTGRFIVECDLELNENGLVKKQNNQVNRVRVPVDAILCDFQLSRYAPPAIDVMSLLANTCSNLKTHQTNLLNLYYDKLCSELAHIMDPDEINEIISRDNFFKSCQDYQLFGYLESTFFNLTILLPPNMSVELIEMQKDFKDYIQEKRRVELSLRAFEDDKKFAERMTQDLCRIIDNYIEL